jgi:hypothetical protein
VRRKRLLLCLGAVAAGLALAWWGPRALLAPTLHNLTPESFERVQEGMTLAEVEATLGGPPGDYTGGGMVPLILLSNTQAWADSRMWVGDELAIDVSLDDRGRSS